MEGTDCVNQAIQVFSLGPLLIKGCMAFLYPSNLISELVPLLNARSEAEGRRSVTKEPTKSRRRLWLVTELISIYRQYLRLADRLAEFVTKPLNPTSVCLTSHCRFQSLNMSPPDSLLTAPHCPSRSYA